MNKMKKKKKTRKDEHGCRGCCRWTGNEMGRGTRFCKLHCNAPCLDEIDPSQRICHIYIRTESKKADKTPGHAAPRVLASICVHERNNRVLPTYQRLEGFLTSTLRWFLHDDRIDMDENIFLDG